MSKPVNRSWKAIVGLWLASLLSVGLLLGSAIAVKSDLSQFRSCNSNTSGLMVHSCGKQSLNPGDLILLALFVLAALLTVSLFTGALRASRRK
jgi:hypothetical protein